MTYTNPYAAHNRRARAIRVADDMIEQFQEWTGARRGWKFHDSETGNWTCWAARAFKYPRHPWIRLTVRFTPARRTDLPPRANDWLAELTPAFSAGPEIDLRGTFDEIQEWITDKEMMLALPLRLVECKSVEEATHVVGQASRPHVGVLGHLFEFSARSTFGIRSRLVSEFCPAARTSSHL